MKNISKFLAVFILGIVTFNTIEAQEYIKVNKDFTDKNIKFFKGEIYAVSDIEGNKKKFMAGDTECEAISDVTIMNEAPQDKTAEKDIFIQLKDNGWLHVDVSSVATGQDTIWLVNTANEKKVPLLTNTVTDLNPNNLNITGNFRLLIPNMITIWYHKNNLTTYAEPQSATATETAVDPVKEENSGKTLIIILIIIIVLLILVIAAIFGYLLYKKKIRSQRKSPILVEYNSGKSLAHFAEDNGIDLMQLLSLNKDTINQSYHEYKKDDQKKIESTLNEMELIVGFKTPEMYTDDDRFQDENTDVTIKKTGRNNIQSGNDFSEQLQQLQNNLIREIRKAGTSGNDQHEVSNLKMQLVSLENENKRLKDAQTNFTNERLSFTGQNQEFNAQNKRLSAKVAEFENRVIIVDYLKGYANSVYSYIKFCQQVSNEALQVYNKIQTSEAGLLLINFQTSVHSIPIGNWLQIIQDIKETGATTNKNLIRSFSQIQNENEKLKEFQRQLFKEALITYSSQLLILAEAFRNISRFQVISERAVDIQDTFGKYVTEIINKAKTVGIDIKYVPLFKNFEEYLGQIQSTDQNRSNAYKEIKGLQKNDIAEIVSYGVKTIFEDSRTYIILA